MKITKLIHSCLLVEMPSPANRTVLFDPGIMSQQAVDVGALEFLDDIVITHNHPDHMSIPLIKQLAAKFPGVRITTTAEAVAQLKEEGIAAVNLESPGIVLFSSPHEDTQPIAAAPDEIGVHYLNALTHPGDSHSFSETKAVLALPVTAPWGSMIKAVNLGLQLKPKYIIPIHDWHWSEQARTQAYETLEELFAEHDIVFLKLQTGVPVVLRQSTDSG